MDYEVYEHYLPGSVTPFYVGMGKKGRSQDRKRRSDWWKRYVEKYGLEVKIIKEGLTKEEAILLEKQFISEYGRINIGTGILINLTDGGEGTVNIVRSEITRKKLSEAQKKNKHSEEVKQKIRNSRIGKLHSDNTRNKISSSMKGKTHSEQTKQKLREINKGKTLTEEQKIKHKEAMRKWFEKKKIK